MGVGESRRDAALRNAVLGVADSCGNRCIGESLSLLCPLHSEEGTERPFSIVGTSLPARPPFSSLDVDVVFGGGTTGSDAVSSAVGRSDQCPNRDTSAPHSLFAWPSG